MIYTDLATAQNIVGENEEICRSPQDAQAETQRLKECDLDRRELNLLRDQLKNKDDKITNLEEKTRLLEQQGQVKDQMIVNQDKVIDQWKDLQDRTMKLAETKKSSIWETMGPLAIIAIIVVTLASVL